MTRQIDAWVAPANEAGGAIRSGDPAVIVAHTFSTSQFVAYAVAKDNQPLIDALNSGLDAVIADGTWAKLYSQWVPRTLPPGWKPGSKAAPDADPAGLRRDRRQPSAQAGGPDRAEVDPGAVARLLLQTGTCTGRRSPPCSAPDCPTR